MSLNEYQNPLNSTSLYEFKDNIKLLINLYKNNKFPKVLMLTGKKGIGKFTLINHFLNYVYDSEYDQKNNIINNNSSIYKQYLNKVFPNIIYLQGSSYKNIKIDDIRKLKSIILKSSLLKKNRFIVLDDIELFNTNSLNALLKVIEEPSTNDYFVLINNKTRDLVDTIYSRSIEVRIALSNSQRIKIIKLLIERNNLKPIIDVEKFYLTPGNFLSFNNICLENKIDINEYLTKNLELLLNLYKKNKDINVINMILFLIDKYFIDLQVSGNSNIEKIAESKSYVINNINKFVTFNLNQNSLINAINEKLSNG